jgi:hypothetical protein
MTHLLMNLANLDRFSEGMGMWIFLSVGAVSLFIVFIPLVSWIDSRRKEREAFYKADTMRRVAEGSGDGAKAALQLLREDERIRRIKTLEGIKIGGLVNLAVGIGVMIFLRSFMGSGSSSPYLCGLIPGLVGVALLVYALFLAAPPDAA